MTPMNVSHLYKRIIDHISTAVCLLNKDLEVQYISPSCEVLFEIGQNKAVGHSITRLFYEPTDLIDRLQKASYPFSEREVVLHIGITRTVTVDYTVNPLTDPSYESGFLIEFVPVDRKLRISREKALIEQQKTTEELLRGMSHEIKNPLGGIRGAAQLLGQELEHAHLCEYTDVIIKEVDRLTNLVNRMLGPNTVLKKQWTNIHEVLEHIQALLKAEHKEISLQRDYDPSIPLMNIDSEQMIQAILNLVLNAVEAMSGKGKLCFQTRTVRQCTIGTVRHKLVVAIKVIDNGPGIPPKIADKLFFPMITGRAEGTGLGLSIAQTIVNHHRGLIEYTSKPGNTVFTVMVPLELDNEKY